MSRSAVAAVAVSIALLAGCAVAPPPAPANAPLRFLLINDVYFGDTVRDGSAGLARVAALRDSLQRTGPVTFVLAGDFLSPSLLSKWYRGEQMRQELEIQMDFRQLHDGERKSIPRRLPLGHKHCERSEGRRIWRHTRQRLQAIREVQ